MKGNFVYHNPTKLIFGPQAMDTLTDELARYGSVVMFCYGGGSIKRNGVYNKTLDALRKAGKTIVEDGGVMSNPTLDKYKEGVDLARKHSVDFILAVGGGSVCDYAKAVAAAQHYQGDFWNDFFLQQQNPPQEQRITPVGCVLTMSGTGSEMNGGSVITDEAHHFKVGHVFDDRLMPRFSVLNPEFTMTVPADQMRAGIYDIMCHIMEQYFCDDDDSTSDYMAEGLMRGLIVSSRRAVARPDDYEARSNIMWSATWALNTLIKCGKTQDWMVHMFGHSIGAWTHASHGFALASVSMAYYHFIMAHGLHRFARFAREVWGISNEGKTEEQLAQEGLDALRSWMQEMGLPLTLREVGATAEMMEGMAKGVVINAGGFHHFTPEEVKEVLTRAF